MSAPHRMGLVLLAALAVASGVREWWMAVAAAALALWALALLLRPRGGVYTHTHTHLHLHLHLHRQRAHPDTQDGAWLGPIRDPVARVLMGCAAAWVLFFALHAVRLDPAQGWARLDGPSRVVVLVPLLAVPLLLDLHWWTLRRLVVVAAWVLGACSIAQGLMQDAPGRNFGFFSYHNLAGYAAVTLLGLLLCTREEPAWRWWSRGAIVLSLLAALSTGTVGALIALPMVAALAMWRWPSTARTGSRGSALVWGGGLAVVLVVAALAWPRIEARALFFLADLQSAPDPQGYNGSTTQRWAMWQVAWAMILDSPWWGQGLHAFPSQMQPWADRLGLGVRFGIEGFGFGGYQNPHNLLLGWAATMGVPTALLLVLLFFGVPLWAVHRLMQLADARAAGTTGPAVARDSRLPAGIQDLREVVVALRLLLALLVVFGLTESVIERQRGMTWFAVWIALMVGTAAAMARRASSPSTHTSAPTSNSNLNQPQPESMAGPSP